MANKKETAQVDLIINGQAANATLKDLEAAARKLNAELRRMPPLADDFAVKAEKLRIIKEKISGVKAEIGGTAASLGKMADAFTRYFAMGTTVFVAVAGAVAAIRELISANASLSDSMADIRKTTGMSMEEVRKLNRVFKNMDTRSSREELRQLAYIAGKLGYTYVSEVKGFVAAADQFKVALAADLGENVEEAVVSVAKLTEIFKIKEKFGIEEAILKTGSAINALGAASSANESYIVEFTRRVGAIAPQAGMSIENIMGLAATLDQLGQSNEIASTAVTQLLAKIFRNTSEYARIAQIDVKEFSDLLSRDTNEALIRFLAGLQKNNGGMAELASKFREMGMEGVRAISVIGVLSGNLDLLRSTQKMSNEEFAKGTSLTNEFNIKNNNMAANLEKVGKALKSWFVNSALLSSLESLVGWMARLTRIPLAEKMEEEHMQVSILVSRLQDLSLSAGERNRIYGELLVMAPSVLDGIDKESIAYARLTSNLEKYNAQMINRIIIQKKQDEIDDQNREVAALRARRLAEEGHAREFIIQKIREGEKSGSPVVKSWKEIFSRENLTFLDKVEEINKVGMPGLIGHLNMIHIVREEEIRAQTASVILLRERSQLMQDLGIKESADTGTAVPAPAGGKAPGATPPSFDVPTEQEKEEYVKYMKNIEKEIQDARVRLIGDEREKELARARVENSRKLQEIKGQGEKENELRLLLGEDLKAQEEQINLRYDDKLREQEEKSEKEKWEAKLKTVEKGSVEWLELTRQYLERAMEMELDDTRLTMEQKQAIREKYGFLEQAAYREVEPTGVWAPKDYEKDYGYILQANRLFLERTGALTIEKKKELAAVERDIALEAARESAAERQLVEEEFLMKIHELNIEAITQTADQLQYAMQSLQQIGETFTSSANARDEADLRRYEANLDKKKKLLKQNLKDGLISQDMYDQEIARMDEELAMERKRIAVEQAEREMATTMVVVALKEAIAIGSAIALAAESSKTPLDLALNILASVATVVAAFVAASDKVDAARAMQYAGGKYEVAESFVSRKYINELFLSRNPGAVSPPLREFFRGMAGQGQGFDVVGSEDGRLYRDVPFAGKAATGIYPGPVLISEQGPELVVDAPTVRNIQINYPWLLEAIRHARVPQQAAGRYPEPSPSSPVPAAESPSIGLEEFNAAVDRFDRAVARGVKAYIVYDELVETNRKIDQIRANVSNTR